jgi:hypothetical protein
LYNAFNSGDAYNVMFQQEFDHALRKQLRDILQNLDRIHSTQWSSQGQMILAST